MYRAAECVRAEPNEGRPGQSTCGVVEQERLPAVVVRAGEYGRENSQESDKPAVEDDLAAVLLEEIFADLKPSLGDVNDRPVANEKCLAEASAGPKSDIVANDRPGCGARDHKRDVQLSGRSKAG
ncbi:MAG: hypothetical protein QOH98_948, partial [Methylobacteriaceae bacterium]|nr:hypothetical protein [Methylobacteriaceae bacterium]